MPAGRNPGSMEKREVTTRLDANYQEALKKIESSLEQLLVGKAPEPIADTTDNTQLDRIMELTNMLSGNFSELETFARNLARGNLDIDPPGRRNYLASPLKELHSQLSGLTWILEQLRQGRIVDKLDYAGNISQALNLLIDRLSGESGPDSAAEDHITSWKYHQILLAFNHLQQMVLLVDKDGRIVFSNHPAAKRLGNLTVLRAEELAEQAPALEQNLSALSTPANTFPVYHEIYDDTRNCWFKITSEQISFPDGSPLYLHSIEDISEWKSNETRLKISATTDHLTGVYNRSMGIKALEIAMQNRNHVVSSAAFVDVDSLKYVNDNFGHNEGDYVIKAISGALSTSVRDSDTVSRFGGDEFLVVFSGCTMEVAEKVISRVHGKIQTVNDAGTKPYPLAFSHGVVQIDEKCATTIQDLITLMDKKMYERKTAKRY